MRLSENFTLAEFLFSQTAKRAQHELEPSQAAIDNMRALCQNVLQPLRELVDAPIRISSGFRDDWLNWKIGGAKNSAHRTGRAADISVDGYTSRELAEIIAGTALPYDKVILEFGDWVHIQIAEPMAHPRHLAFTARHNAEGVTEYLPDIV